MIKNIWFFFQNGILTQLKSKKKNLPLRYNNIFFIFRLSSTRLRRISAGTAFGVKVKTFVWTR